MLDQIIHWITPAVEHLHMAGYWIALLAAMAETVLGVGLLLPGSTIILILGAFAAHGYLELGDLILFAFVGAVAGDNINYFLGKKYGARWTREGFWFLQEDHFQKAKAFFDKHGAISVLWGRLIPSVKEIVPFIAGLVQMKQRTFLLWNVLGAACWAFLWVLAGYFFAQSLYLARVWLSRMGFLAAILIGSTVLTLFVRRAVQQQGRQILALFRSLGRSIKQAIVTNTEIEKLVHRHQRFFGILGRRLDKSTFAGLPLTLLSASFLYVLILFGGVVEDLLTGDPIVALDVHIANLMAVFRTPILVRIFLWVTMLGKWQVILVFSACLVAALWIWKERHLIMPFLTTLSGSQIFVYLGKVAFHRPRPELSVYTEHSFSFPSGHAAVSVACYGFLTYVLVGRTTDWKKKINFLFVGTIVVLLIGFSRIYLGVHYLSDVWSGYLIGSLWLIIGVALSQYRKSVRTETTTAQAAWARWASAALAFAVLVFYVGFTMTYLPGIPFASFSKSTTTVNDPVEIFRDEPRKYTESVTGGKQQPVNVVFVAQTDQQLARVLRRAGWQPVDMMTPNSVLKTVGAALSGTDYPSAPVMPSFWDDRVNDLAFRNATDSPGEKIAHVLYLWKTFFKWPAGRSVYIGQVGLNSGLIWGLTHRISLNVDGERKFLYQSLLDSKALDKYSRIDLVEPQSGQSTMGDTFITDGKAVFLIFKPGPGSGNI